MLPDISFIMNLFVACMQYLNFVRVRQRIRRESIFDIPPIPDIVNFMIILLGFLKIIRKRQIQLKKKIKSHNVIQLLTFYR